MRIIRIESCAECPHFNESFSSKGGWCETKQTTGIVDNPDTIPDWCPLEKEEGE